MNGLNGPTLPICPVDKVTWEWDNSKHTSIKENVTNIDDIYSWVVVGNQRALGSAVGFNRNAYLPSRVNPKTWGRFSERSIRLSLPSRFMYSMRSSLASAQYSFLWLRSIARPFGQPIDVLTRVTRSDPSRFDCSIFVSLPQSVQYICLKQEYTEMIVIIITIVITNSSSIKCQSTGLSLPLGTCGVMYRNVK